MKEKKNIIGKNQHKGNHAISPMNETKFNKFKPDTGAEFYDEENPIIKVYSSKNTKKKR
jgi:hypothetical protein